MKCIILLIFIPLSTFGQVNQYWTDFNIEKRVEEGFAWQVNLGPRFVDGVGFSTLFSRFEVRYQKRKFVPIAGVGFWLNKVQQYYSNETRLWQGFRVNFKLPFKITFRNQFRLEERWIHLDQTEFVLRGRFQTGFAVNLYENLSKSQRIYSPITYEIFENFDKYHFINLNRWDFGVGVSKNKHRWEVHYILQHRKKIKEESFYWSENIFRLRWFYNI